MEADEADQVRGELTMLQISPAGNINLFSFYHDRAVWPNIICVQSFQFRALQSASFQIRLVSKQTLQCICVKRLEGHGPSPGAAGIELGFPNHVSIFARVMSPSR